MWFIGVPSMALQYFTYQYFINTGTPYVDIFLYKLEIQRFQYYNNKMNYLLTLPVDAIEFFQ